MLATAIATVREELREATRALAAAGIDTPRVDAEWLLAHALGRRRLDLSLAPADRLPAGSVDAFREAVRRRARREPLQRIIGWEAFRGLRLRLTADVLVPRPETEMLVEYALGLLPPSATTAPLIIDLGTGSGCVACALAQERPDVRVLAVDVSPPAAAVALDNAGALGLAARVTVIVADLLTALRPLAADMIVSNPPYLPTALLSTLTPEVAEHEPRLAVDGGPDGLATLRSIVATAPASLRRGGVLLVETGGGAQAGTVAGMMRESGLVDVARRADLAGVERFVAGRTACVE